MDEAGCIGASQSAARTTNGLRREAAPLFGGRHAIVTVHLLKARPEGYVLDEGTLSRMIR